MEKHGRRENVPGSLQHRTGEPIGNWDISTLKEDKHGLFGEGPCGLKDAAYAKTAWRGMKTRAITAFPLALRP
ncbi:HK97 family phage prohead protease [Klebsiella michiganensis]|uniref:HK97 family phage prohead protease n=1 Tax=Klebsiella michiganensis TaxID=1134687 RepID=UPI0022284549|nr:HK97 family phage prohead protease [Klebsiella michiganensis]